MTLQFSVQNQVTPSKGLLAAVSFGASHEIGDDPRHVRIGLPLLNGGPYIECWTTQGTVETGKHGDISFTTDGDYFFGHMLLEETPGNDLDKIGYHAYQTIVNWLKDFGGLHLLRMWNYVKDINVEDDHLERYRGFCVGRSRALEDRDIGEAALPAASCVGGVAPGVVISFLATKTPGLQVENPRQMSAFHYPERYGPRSPSFSRALVYPTDSSDSHLYISGTASIIGHETVHLGDIDKQCEETIRNMNTLIESAGNRHEMRAFRAYVRHREQSETVLGHLRDAYGSDVALIAVEADICRDDLLTEIEAVATT